MMEVAGIEPAPPKYMQDYEIIDYYWYSKNTNVTGVMGQVKIIKITSV